MRKLLMIASLIVMTTEVIFAKTPKREEIKITKLSEFETSQGVEQLTGRAYIVLPRNVTVYDRYKIQELFKPGDPVEIKAGYNGNISTIFRGYITMISADIPLSIKCEDEMYKLKQIPVSFASSNISLKELISKIYSGKVNVLKDIEIGAVRLPNTTVAKVLEKLKDSPWNIRSFMDADTLIVGPAYSRFSSVSPVKIHLEKEIAQNSLTYKENQFLNILIQAVNINSNGKKTFKYEYGEKGGDEFKLTYYNRQNLKELVDDVIKDYQKKKTPGFDGDITMFGEPLVKIGQKVSLTSDIYPDRNGTYYIDGVDISFGPGGFRQKVKIGDKVIS